jgi:hypothetical protein
MIYHIRYMLTLPACSAACSRHNQSYGSRHCYTPWEFPLCAPSINGIYAWHPPFRIWAASAASRFLTHSRFYPSHPSVQHWCVNVILALVFQSPTLPFPLALPHLGCRHCFAFSCPLVLLPFPPFCTMLVCECHTFPLSSSLLPFHVWAAGAALGFLTCSRSFPYRFLTLHAGV